MILKILLVLAVIGIVYFLFFKKKPSVVQKTKKREDLKASDMIECKTCGVYVAIDEAILSGSSYYCSNECIGKAS